MSNKMAFLLLALVIIACLLFILFLDVGTSVVQMFQ